MSRLKINDSLFIIRQYWGKTQVEMARDLGVSQSYISEIEKGKREVTLDLLNKYSQSLNVPMSSLMLFAEEVAGAPPMGRGRRFIAGRALEFLRKLLPDDLQEAG